MKQHALIQGTEVRVCAKKDGNSLRRVAFSGGFGYADTVKYHYTYDQVLADPAEVQGTLNDRSAKGWELVSTQQLLHAREPGSGRISGNDWVFFWKKPVE